MHILRYINLKKNPYGHNLFSKYEEEEGRILIIWLYVDDIIYTSNDAGMIQEFQSFMKKEFDMINLGLMKYYLVFIVSYINNAVVICAS